jgi:hypothetical protein
MKAPYDVIKRAFTRRMTETDENIILFSIIYFTKFVFSKKR